MKFGPSLLKKYHPKLISISFGERGLALEAWNVIINYDLLPFSIFADFQAIDTQIVLLIIKEKFGNAARHFR